MAGAKQPVGVQFTETMRGFISTKETDNYKVGFKTGKKDGSPFEFTLTVISDDVDRLIAEETHEARMEGTVTCPALSEKPMKVTDGRFNLFVVDPDRVDARKMLYSMAMRSEEGKTYFMEGFKEIHDDFGLDLWPDTTTLYVTLHEGENAEGPVIGKGIIHIKVKDFAKQMTTMKAINAANILQETEAIAKFGKFFASVLQDIYGGIIAKANVFNPDAAPRKRRPLRMDPPETYDFPADDGVHLRLVRFEGGKKGPVVLSPGFGVTGASFYIDTTDTNLPEFLYERGYDVWVFSYRASPDLPSASIEFTLDDIAKRDYPAAVAKILEVSGADSVQAVAHCVGSLSLLMGLSLGLKGVRSMVSSQLTLHPVSPTLNDVKAGLHLPSLMIGVGIDTLSTDYNKDAGWLDRASDKLLRLYPTREWCTSPVCRRILFMFGESYSHDQLNQATHDALHEMFGVANVTAFKQIARILNKGFAVSADGEDCYLPNYERLNMPIAFIHGAKNRIFLPEGSKKTFDFLCEKNGPENYVRRVIPDYAHMDCFIGKRADKDVYPIILEELDKYNPA